MNPRKKQKIEEMLRRELSTIILYEMKDPRAGFVTVTGVELAQDQRTAKVLLTVRGTEEEMQTTIKVLTCARGFLQGIIAKRIPLRWTPVLSFEEDTEIRNVMRVEKLIQQARTEDRRTSP